MSGVYTVTLLTEIHSRPGSIYGAFPLHPVFPVYTSLSLSQLTAHSSLTYLQLHTHALQPLTLKKCNSHHKLLARALACYKVISVCAVVTMRGECVGLTPMSQCYIPLLSLTSTLLPLSLLLFHVYESGPIGLPYKAPVTIHTHTHTGQELPSLLLHSLLPCVEVATLHSLRQSLYLEVEHLVHVFEERSQRHVLHVFLGERLSLSQESALEAYRFRIAGGDGSVLGVVDCGGGSVLHGS